MRVPLFVAVLATAFSAAAAPVFSDNFNSYANGDLAGQGPWLVTDSIFTTPPQVSSGAVILGPVGEDVYAPLSPVVNNTAGTSIYVGASINVSNAHNVGDYFLHLERTLGTTSTFYDKVFAKATTGGFLLGFQDLSGTIVYGSTVLSLHTDYRIILGENFVSGDMNDTFNLYVNPTDLSVPANNTAYLSATWTSLSSEAPSFAGVNLRQGTSTDAPTLTLDNLVVSQTFSDVAAVPEATTFALIGLGGAALLIFRRRK